MVTYPLDSGPVGTTLKKTANELSQLKSMVHAAKVIMERKQRNYVTKVLTGGCSLARWAAPDSNTKERLTSRVVLWHIHRGRQVALRGGT